MSKYKYHTDFINRTLDILENYEVDCLYEKTLFLNCCIGLLVMPQQYSPTKDICINNEVSYDEWGIDKRSIKINKHKKGISKYSAENIAYHIRNAICHYRFDILDCNKEEINRIHIVDRIPSSDNIITFDLELPFEDFRKFVMKYANICKKELERVGL